MSAFVDTNLLVRHLTGDPPDMAARATSYLAAERELLLGDVIVAETIYVLESFYYEAPRVQVAAAMRSLLAVDAVVTLDAAMLLRAIEIYEIDRLDFADAYLVAAAETTGKSVESPHSIEASTASGRPSASSPAADAMSVRHDTLSVVLRA